MPVKFVPHGLPSSCAIVGSNGAIGSAVATRLAALGIAIHGFDIDDESASSLTSYTQLPASDPDGQLARFAEQLVNTDAGSLVIASGVYPARQLSTETVASLQETLTVNAIVPALLVRSFAERNTAPDAPVVVTSSLAALRPRVGTAAYSTSKIALERLLAALTLEYRAYGVRINVVQPGYVSSQSAINPIPDAYDSKMKEAGTSSIPADLVDTYLWLLSATSRQIHGGVIPLDRGMHIGSSVETAWLE